MTVAPWVKLSGQTSYSQGVARRSIADDGSFTWQRRTGTKIHVYFATVDGSVLSFVGGFHRLGWTPLRGPVTVKE